MFGSSARTRTCESVSGRINSRLPGVAESIAYQGIIRFGSSARTRTWNPSVNSTSNITISNTQDCSKLVDDDDLIGLS
jgi:hypothetical protein